MAASSGIIFFDKGKPLRIYLATDIDGHTELVHRLRNNGASTTFSPGDAQIILVNDGTQVTAELLYAFPDKLFLDVEWAHSALQRGSFASENEGWGGYLVQSPRSESRPGIPSNISPLPTPRRTPVPVGDTQLPHQPNIMDSSMLAQAYISQAMRMAPAANQAIGQQVPIPALQLPPGNTLPFALPPGMSTIPQTGAVNQTSVLSPQDILNLVAQLLNRVAQDDNSRNQFQAHQWPSQGISSSQSPLYTQATPQYAPLPAPSDGDLATSIMNTLRFQTNPVSTTSALKRKAWRDPSDLLATSREDAEARYSPQLKSMDDEEFQPKERKYPGRHDKRIFTDEDDEALHFYVSPSVYHRPKIVDRIKKHGGKITPDVPDSHFVVLSNNSDHFFETLRSAVASDVPAVKADFIMESIRAKSLLDPADFSFDGDTLRRKRGSPIVIDLAEIRRETHGERRQKGKRSRNAGREYERSPVESEDGDEQASRHTSKTPPSPKKPSRSSVVVRPKTTKKRKIDQVRVEHEVSRSPSPIAPNTVIEIGGRHRYTAEEREYWPKYVAHVLKYEPSCTQTKLSQLLSAKMPHHPAPSWATAILMPNRAKIEDLRKKAFIDIRKADAAKSPSAEPKDQPEIESGGENSRETIFVPQERSLDLEQDLEIVTQFIMDGGADNIPDDSDVWKVLEEQHSCRTQKNWEVFWEEHGEEVTKEVQDRTAVNAQVKVETDA